LEGLRWDQTSVRNTKLKFLVTYADPAQGHLGTIYQATNWHYTGRSEAMPLYDVGDGEARHSRSLSHSYRTHSMRHFAAHGVHVKLVPQSRKYRYVYFLDLGRRPRLRVPVLPYSKHAVPMRVIDLTLAQLREAPWTPNKMGQPMLDRLRESIRSYGLLSNLVVRPLRDGAYEVLSGNQRLQKLRVMGYTTVPCVVVDLDDAQTRLLSQALNRIQGEDDLGSRAELVRGVLKELPQEEVLRLLPKTAESLQALVSLGQQDMVEYLTAWQRAQSARLKHLQFQLLASQLEAVEEVLARLLPLAREAGKLLEDLPVLWEGANLAERRTLLLSMLDGVYVDTVEEKSIVAIRPKPAFRPLFEVATTKESSGVVLISVQPPGRDQEAVQRSGLLKISEGMATGDPDPCFWWRRGRVGLCRPTRF
jgi:ParB family chromosome partitioning protein